MKTKSATDRQFVWLSEFLNIFLPSSGMRRRVLWCVAVFQGTFCRLHLSALSIIWWELTHIDDGSSSYETPSTATRLHNIVLKNGVFFTAVVLRTTNLTKQKLICRLFNDAVRNSYVRTIIWIAYRRTVVVGWLRFCLGICVKGLRKSTETSARTAGLWVEIWSQDVPDIKQSYHKLRYSYWLWAGWSGDRIPVGARFSAPVNTSSKAHPASCAMGTGSFPGVKSGRGATLTLHPF
jgi:hypothetical protein